VFYNPKFDDMPLLIEGGPTAEYEQANEERAQQMAVHFQALQDRDRAESLWQSGQRAAAMAILQRNPNVGVEYRGLVNNQIVRSGTYFGQDASDFLNGINIAVNSGLLTPVTQASVQSQGGFSIGAMSSTLLFGGGGQEPKYPPVKDDEVNIVYAGDQFERVEGEYVAAIVGIANSQKCSDMFKKYNLKIPYDVVKAGDLRVAGTAVFYRSNATTLLRWSAAQVQKEREFHETQNNTFYPNKTADYVIPGIPTVVFNPSQARNPKHGGIRTIVTHAFIHLGGQRGDPNAAPHDLSNFAGYQNIIDACK